MNFLDKIYEKLLISWWRIYEMPTLIIVIFSNHQAELTQNLTQFIFFDSDYTLKRLNLLERVKVGSKPIHSPISFMI